MSNSNKWSIEIAETNDNDRGNIRRYFDENDSPSFAFHGCQTLYEVLRRGNKINPLGPCFGFRAVSTDSGYATPFIFSSYTECVSRVECFAAGLERMNLVNKNEDGMLLLGLYCVNCMEWVIAEHGIFSIGGATVPLYNSLGAGSVEFILCETNMSTVVCVRSELENLCRAKKSNKCPEFQNVILVDGVIPSALKAAEEAGLSVVSFAKVESIGAQVIGSEGHSHKPPTGKDLATFCYTSGTTGNPKGAMLSHENIISVIASEAGLALTTKDRYLSFLPLPHIMERICMGKVLASGGSIGFYRGDPLLLMEDVKALRPTVFVAAPRVLNRIHDKVKAGFMQVGGMKKKLFFSGLSTKTERLKRGYLRHSFYDRLIFNKIKYALGFDQVRVMISGSAPLSDNVMIFFRCLLGVPVLEGYGQTEGSGLSSLSDVHDMATFGHVGGPANPGEMVLIDVPEMGYLRTDTSHRGQPCCGRGEICIRGPNVFLGYYKDPVKTAETIDKHGWLHSGDIGMWAPQGQLKIIDRKKNIFKLAQGEYIAPEKN